VTASPRSLDLRLRTAAAAYLAVLTACSGAPLPSDLDRAQKLERSGDGALALEAYRAVREDCERSGRRRPHDDCALAAFREAQLEEHAEAWPRAYEAYRRVAPLSSDPRKSARAQVRAAEIAHEHLADDQAAAELAWATVERFPDEVPADDSLKLAVQIDRARDPAQVARRLEGLAERFRGLDIGDNLIFARAELEESTLGDPVGAVAIYDRLVERYPRSGLKDDALYRSANILRKAGDAKGALKHLQQIVDSRRDALITGSYNSLYLDDAELLYGQICLDDLHDPARAADVFQTLADFPDSVLRDDALFELSRAEVAREDVKAACRALAKLLRRFPNGNRVRAARQRLGELRCEGAAS
jgi:tetratricopeptide (TPR) repeat protein